MDKDLIIGFKMLIFVFIIILFFAFISVYVNDKILDYNIKHYTTTDEINYCINERPIYNSTYMVGHHSDEHLKFYGGLQKKCFTEHWEVYCKFIDPENC